jgi:outer membrane protein assembly factor BamB
METAEPGTHHWLPPALVSRGYAAWTTGCLLGLALWLTACGGSDQTRSASSSSSTTAAQPTVSSPSRGTKAPRRGGWTTYHGGAGRTGSVASGPALGRARNLWSARVDGAVYAQPLVLAGVVLVVTENNSVYAFDATSGRSLWRTHLATPVAGGDLPCGNIDPSGITSTPVADAAAGVLYAVAFHSGFHHVLHALSVSSGRVLWSRGVDPPGEDPRFEQQRSALALANRRVLVSYGGLYGDCGSYHGWVVGAPSAGPSGSVVSYRVPTGNGGAVWAPSGPAVDTAGNVYVSTGNGSSSSFDYGNSVIKLSPSLQMLGFFAPQNAGALSQSDLDLGSTGPVLLPRSLAFIIGKAGVGYLLDTNQLGGVGHPLDARPVCAGAFGGVAYAHGVLYVPCTDGVVAVTVSGGKLSVGWRQSSATQSPIVAGAGVWTIGGDSLYQLDLRNGQVRFSAAIGTSAHFASPATADTRIYVAAGDRIVAFG